MSKRELFVLHFSFQHIFDIFGVVAFETLHAELLTGLFSSDELALDPEPSVSDFLSAVITDFFFPDSFFSKEIAQTVTFSKDTWEF